MIDCGFVQENLSAYIDEELAAEEGRQIRHHLQTCQVCNKEYTELLITATIMRSLQELDPPAQLKERVKERLLGEATSSPVARIKRIKWYSFGAVAAGLLLLVGSWNFFFAGGMDRFPRDTATTQEIAQGAPEAGKGIAVEQNLEAQPFTMAMPQAASEAAAPPEEGSVFSEPSEPVEKEAAVTGSDAEPERAMQASPGQAGLAMSPPDQAAPAGEQGSVSRSVPEAAEEEVSVAFRGTDRGNGAVGSGQEGEQPAAGKMMAMGVLPAEEGLRLELELKTQDLSQTHRAIERIAHVYQLEVGSQENDQVLQVEVFVPISQQGDVLEELKGLGHVTGESASNPELNDRVTRLLADKKELVQQQIELRALLSNGGSPENMAAWKMELAAVTEEVDAISAQLAELETQHGPTCIKLTLVK